MSAGTESQRSDWMFSAIVTMLCVACFAWIHRQSDARAQAAGPADPSGSGTQLAMPTSPSPALAISRPAASQSDSIVEVYECVEEGQRILSDRLCGPSANVLKVRAPNRMNAQDTGVLYRDTQSNRAYSRSPPHWTNYEHESSACPRIEAQIDVINARMRQAYTSQEGERLRQRLRQLSEERHAARCIR